MSYGILSDIYLSAFTPLGFVSRLGLLCDAERFDRVVLLKGGSSALRSSLIAAAAENAESRGKAVTRTICAQDENKLEAAFWDKTAVIDSAPPYCIEPTLPCAFEEVVWLGSCYDDAVRSMRNELIRLQKSEEECMESARKFLFAADELNKYNGRAALCCADIAKIERQAERAAKKYLRPSKGDVQCCISHGQFSSRTVSLPSGFALILLQDSCGGCAALFLKRLFYAVKRMGCEAAVFYSPLAPYDVIDMLLLPESGVCFAVESEKADILHAADSVINARRFTDKQKLSQISAQLKQNRRAAQQLFQRAEQQFIQASCFRQKKEEIYNSFFNNAEFDTLRQSFFDNIF